MEEYGVGVEEGEYHLKGGYYWSVSWHLPSLKTSLLCVTSFLKLKPSGAGTFWKNSAAASNNRNMASVIFRLFIHWIFAHSLTFLLSAVYERRHSRCFPMEPEKSCRKALPRLQRGPYGIATGGPLQPHKAAIATPGGPYGRKTGPFPDIKKIRNPRSGNAVRPSRGRCDVRKWCFWTARRGGKRWKWAENELEWTFSLRRFCKII